MIGSSMQPYPGAAPHCSGAPPEGNLGGVHNASPAGIPAPAPSGRGMLGPGGMRQAPGWNNFLPYLIVSILAGAAGSIAAHKVGHYRKHHSAMIGFATAAAVMLGSFIIPNALVYAN
jgi:hypothetical protein